MAMSEEHKAALAQGRREARAVKAYLKALQSRKPGRPVTKQSLQSRLSSVEEKIGDADDPLRRLELVQARLEIEQALEELEDAVSLDRLEEEFVACAQSYSERKGISYPAWRELGVPAATLRRAGIRETRRR